MGNHIKNTACPECSTSGNGTSLSVYDDGVFCNECGYTTRKETDQFHKGTVVDIPSRGLTKEALGKYGVQVKKITGHLNKTSYVYEENCVLFNFYSHGRLEKQKVRSLEDKSKFTQIGKTKSSTLFGQHLFSPTKKVPVVVCYKPHVELLTQRGWVALKDLNKTDLVMQVDENGEGELVKPTKYIDYEYSGKFINYKSGSYQVGCTDGHAMVRELHGKYVRVNTTEKYWKPVPRVLNSIKSNINSISYIDIKRMVMFSADFSVDKLGAIKGAFKKSRKINRVRELLSGIKYTESVQKSGITAFYIPRQDGVEFTKEFNHDLLTKLSKKQLLVLLDELIHWDGNAVPNRNQAEYSTKFLSNATFVQTCAHLCGMVSSIIRRKNKHGSWYKVSILYNKKTSSTQNKWSTSYYEGRVMCVNVPSGMLLIRDRESISVCGNCEGEFDAVAVYQAMGYPSVSMGSCTSLKYLRDNLEYLAGFSHVVLCFDNDEGGQNAIDAAIGMFEPGGVRVAHLPLKDANDMVKAGRVEELKRCIWNAEIRRPSTIVTISDVLKQVRKKPSFGIPWPYQTMNKVTYGLMPGDMYTLAAAEGVGKCLAPGTKVIMSDGRYKKVEDIKPGDYLMGIDSQPKLVTNIGNGVDNMYKIIPTKGKPYVVNSEHILTLKSCTDRYGLVKNKLYDIPVKEWLKLNKSKKKHLMSIRTGIELPEISVDFCPYIYGTWIGDGIKQSASIVNMDEEVLQSWRDYAKEVGLEVSEYFQNSKATQLALVSRGIKNNKALTFVRSSVKNNNKIILDEYKYNSCQIRLQLLAGILDTDGHLSGANTYEIVQENKSIADDIDYIARSLGFMVTRSIKTVSNTNYHRLHISGDTNRLPIRVKRKQAKKRSKFKCHLSFGINVEPAGKGKYYGFTLQGDKHFLLEDFQITHNTEFIKELIFDLVNKEVNVGLFSFEQDPSSTVQRFVGGELGKKLHLHMNDDDWWDENEIEEIAMKWDNRLFLYNNIGTLPLEVILLNIRYLAKAHNVKFIVLDNLSAMCATPLIDGKVVRDIDYITHVAGKVDSLCKELKISAMIVAHLSNDTLQKQVYVSTSPKNPGSYMNLNAQDMDELINKPGMTWESGRVPQSNHIFGGGMLRKLSSYVIVLARNSVSLDPEESRTTKVKFLKTRLDSSHTGLMFDLKYNYATGRLEEDVMSNIDSNSNSEIL